MKKVVRSVSGILPVTVVLKPQPCKHGHCIYCPSQENVPVSYTAKSAPVLRAVDCNYESEAQIKARLNVYKKMGHPTDKVELIVIGGTFSDYPLEYQRAFIKGCFDGLNCVVSRDLAEAQKINERSEQRCVGLCVETRPDRCNPQNINNLLELGVTRIELGVQCLNDKIYEIVKRGHTVDDVVRATKLLKDSCFKVGYHMMLGLPGSSPEEDIENFKRLFSDQRFQPDQLKIYPTFIIKGTPLEKMYRNGEYKPYSTEEIVEILVKIKQIIPKYVRIMKIMRDIPAEYILSECKYSHLRDKVQQRLDELGVKCNCIRCREIGHRLRKGEDFDNDFKLSRIDYAASDGREIFLSFESKDTLVSLLRLRIPAAPFRPEITERTALVREMHTFGPMVKIGQEGDFQHRGYGKALLQEAERIAAEEFDCNKVLIISAVGVRPYFLAQGYNYDGPYVSKMLRN
jgi:elongator complex protein 3